MGSLPAEEGEGSRPRWLHGLLPEGGGSRRPLISASHGAPGHRGQCGGLAQPEVGDLPAEEPSQSRLRGQDLKKEKQLFVLHGGRAASVTS